MPKNLKCLSVIESYLGHEINIYNDGDVVIHFYSPETGHMGHVILKISDIKQVAEEWDKSQEEEK